MSRKCGKYALRGVSLDRGRRHLGVHSHPTKKGSRIFTPVKPLPGSLSKLGI